LSWDKNIPQDWPAGGLTVSSNEHHFFLIITETGFSLSRTFMISCTHL